MIAPGDAAGLGLALGFDGPFGIASPFRSARRSSARAYPEASLSLTATLRAGTPLNANVNKYTHALFAVDFVSLDLSINGFVWESGGAGYGNYVGVKDGLLVVRAGSGADRSAAWPAGTTYLLSDVPGGTGTLAWSIELGAGVTRVRAWWRGVELRGAGNVGLSRSDWGGVDEGVFMSTSGGGGVVLGEPAPAGGVATCAAFSGLRYYMGQKAGVGMLSAEDAVEVAAVGGGVTPDAPAVQVLANDDVSALSVVSAGGVAIAPAGSVEVAGSGGGLWTVSSDGAAVFAPGADFAALLLGGVASSSVSYRTDRGGRSAVVATVSGGLSLSYSLAVEDGGSFAAAGDPVGALPVGTLAQLGGLSPITAQTVAAVTRTGGGPGVASLAFGAGAALRYAYMEAPAVWLVAFALRVVVEGGASGRIAETVAANGAVFRVEVLGANLVLRVTDGAGFDVSITRAVPGYGEAFTFAASLGPDGLMLALSGDGAGDVAVASAAGYAPPEAATLSIGGGGAAILGGSLYHPAAFAAAGLAAVVGEVSNYYSPSPFIDEAASSAGVTFSDITDPVDGLAYRLAVMAAGSSIVVARDADWTLQILGGGGGGGESYGGQSAGGGGAGRFLTISGAVPAGTYTATIGAGGARNHLSAGSSGGATILTGPGGEFARAIGGGGGGRGAGNSTTETGRAGGSGGGGGYNGSDAAPGGAALAGVGVGFAGGLGGTAGFSGTSAGAGGGGGAGQVGSNGDAASKTSCGGDGVMSTITGAEVYYCGGGGGARVIYETFSVPALGAGGLGGGGRGHQANNSSGASGDAGTLAAGVARPASGGGGGGGSKYNGTATAGATGSIHIRWRR
jgi:hypothetical protein